MLDRSIGPELKVPDPISLKAPIKRTLKTGVPLYFIPTPGIKAIKCEVIMPLHNSSYVAEDALVPFFTLNMLLEGIKGMNSSELDDFFDYYASEVEVHVGHDRQGLSLLSTKKRFDNVLPVFRALFTEATLPPKELKKRKSQKKLGIALQREQASGRANQLIRQALFGENHPFGYTATEAHVDGISADKIRAYYQDHFRILPEIFVTGDLEEEELQTLEKTFEDLPFRDNYQRAGEINPFPGKRMIEPRPQAMQESMRLGVLALPKSHPDYFPLWVFNTTYGGYFGSRIIKNIREDKGYTYGIYSFLSSISKNDYWMVMADVKKGHAEEVIAECYKELKILANTPLYGEELETLRNYMTGSFLSEFSSAFDLMGKFKRVHHQGLDFDFYNKQLQYIKTFDPEEVSTVGGKYLQENRIKEVIVGS
ncbi:M16 family metallopeptidase [Pleomorphovibrio marinus]|uniref:M16 family metallopeptidase n=1 Tax=Pleomorphovibrio marinus TaxID=2164132 RepID=UPI002937175F|nr:pitrilysin family protein [Pleomorphovibrio marinus]